MIDRLLELRLSAFRAYGGAVTVPLDADVVLVHGSNGRGKSSLLAAVELAISGRVADLAHFDDDYPRCLRHLVPAGVEVGPTEVELAYRSGDGRAERRLVRRVQPRGGRKKGDEVVFEGLTPASDDAAPTEAAQRFFLERGYLSQRRLGRLLEIYQAPDPTSKEQPLVRVLRELLGLDPIGHLTLGLHATQNPRWLRSRSSALRRLADEETRLDRDRKGWEARIATTREDLRQRLTELRDISPLFADHVPEDLGGETPESIDLDTPTTVFKGGAPDFDRIYRGLAEAHRRRGVLETWKRILDLADGTAAIRAEADRALAELAATLDIEDAQPAIETLAAALDGDVDYWREATRQARVQEGRRLRAGLVLERALTVRQRLLDAFDQDASFKQREADLSAVRQRIDAIVDSAKAVRDAALDVQQRFVAPVFDERLNRFWSDLFGRLALAEAFRPELSEPETYRGRLQATTRAVLGEDGEQGFEQLGAILSSGNLNTAALTLFVALHFLEEPAARVLVIDDPVQAMDDVHTVQLAGLLRAIARGPSPRQLILAVHERALFDYLRLELGPTTDGASLLAVEVEREPGAPQSTIRWERDEWRPDPVRFG